nr:hypothetical protein L321_00197 [Pseudomonas plecoglossicida NB2011]
MGAFGWFSYTTSRDTIRSSHVLRKAGALSAPVWQAGYHDRALRREEDVVMAARYIIANPLRAGLADKVGDYPHWDAVWV